MKHLTLIILFLVVGASALSQKSEVFVSPKGAIDGYDAVAFFTEGKAVEGEKNFTTEWKNENWYFASQANLDLFQADPERYAPQYGGYCAFGMSRGYKAKTDPHAWTIVNGKLYLNYNTDVRVEWNKQQKELIEKADKNWPSVKSKE